jgi:lipoprotein-releasing system permease protein
MNLKVAWYLGIRYWWTKKSDGFTSFVVFFSVTGIILGMVSLILVSSIMNGLEGQQKARILGMTAHVRLTPQLPLTFADLNPKLQALEAWSQVKTAQPVFEHPVLIQSATQLRGVNLQGVVTERRVDPYVAAQLVAGQMTVLQPRAYQVILGLRLAQYLQVDVGDEVRIISSEGAVHSLFGTMPLQKKFTVGGLLYSGSISDELFAMTHYHDAVRLGGTSDQWVKQIRLYLYDAFDAQRVAQHIQQQFPDQYQIQLWSETFGHQFDAVKMEKRMMSLMLILIIIVAIFNIVSALVMMVHSKTRDMAILKTQGMTESTVRLIFLIQGLLSAVMGLSVGTGLGWWITTYFARLLQWLPVAVLPPGVQLPIDIHGEQILGFVVGTLVITLCAIWYPATRAAQVYPAEVLRHA